MEENKTNVVSMGTEDKPEKLTYEQLENVAHQLSEQTNILYKRLQDANMTNAFKRLDYLFKVLEFKAQFTKEFVAEAVAEIVNIMTIPEETTEEEK